MPETTLVTRLWLVLLLFIWAGAATRARAADAPSGGGDVAVAQPAPSITGQIAVMSDYVYRGVTYNEGNPALQATVSWSNLNGSILRGLHIDATGSNVDFGPGDPAH